MRWPNVFVSHKCMHFLTDTYSRIKYWFSHDYFQWNDKWILTCFQATSFLKLSLKMCSLLITRHHHHYQVPRSEFSTNFDLWCFPSAQVVTFYCAMALEYPLYFFFSWFSSASLALYLSCFYDVFRPFPCAVNVGYCFILVTSLLLLLLVLVSDWCIWSC